MSFPTIPRRVVTGTKNGRSVITEDTVLKNVSEEIPGLVLSDIWATNAIPAPFEEHKIPNVTMPVTPGNGTFFRYVQIPPDSELDLPPVKEGMLHPLMHQTDTLDYIVILSGELWLILEESETLLKPGDIVIQRGTNHAWSNRSDQPCIQLAVLIDAAK